MKRFIKYIFVTLVIMIATYLMINISNVLAIRLSIEYKADRQDPYTGELYFDSLVWSSAMFCNQHGGPYFNKADKKITITGTVGDPSSSVNIDVTEPDTYVLKTGTHPDCFEAGGELTLTAESYSGKSIIGSECGDDSVSVAGTVYGTGEIHYTEGGGMTAVNDEVAYLLAEAAANTPGLVPRSSYPNIAWWNRNEAAVAANSGKESVFDDDPTMSDAQEKAAKDAIIRDNQTQINKLNDEKKNLNDKIDRWQTIINKYETKIDGYKDNIASLQEEIDANNKSISTKRTQINNYQSKLNTANSQLNAKNNERATLVAQGKNTQKVDKEIASLKSNIKAYQDAIDGLNDDITILTNENSALQSQINRYNNLISAIEDPQTTKQYNSSIPRYKKYIRNAQKRIKTIESQIAQLQKEIQELNEYFKNRLKKEKNL